MRNREQSVGNSSGREYLAVVRYARCKVEREWKYVEAITQFTNDESYEICYD
jgi:hypothetical protein